MFVLSVAVKKFSAASDGLSRKAFEKPDAEALPGHPGTGAYGEHRSRKDPKQSKESEIGIKNPVYEIPGAFAVQVVKNVKR